MNKRVVVTGMGVTTPLGCTTQDFWNALCSGQNAIDEITVCNMDGFTFNRGGEVKVIPLSDQFKQHCGSLDRATLLAASATQQAVEAAGIDNLSSAAVVLASNFGSIETCEQDLGTDSPTLNGSLGFDNTISKIASFYNCSGPVVSVSLSCSSGAAAIGYASDLIKSGKTNTAIAGGYDAISHFAWAGLSVLRTMTQDMVRPFSKNRAGTLFSEGAGVVILEDLESALARNATIYAEITGFGFNNNAFHITAPAKEGKGLADAMTMALSDNGLSPACIDHVNTHGTGTAYNDLTETQAIKTTLGKHAYQVPITSIKSMVGHLMGAAGSVEAISSILSLNNNLIPPTINFQEEDPECDLPLVKDTPLAKELNNVICNSSGIGGNNVSLILSKFNNGEAN